MNKDEINGILKALKGALYLISEEYESLIDETLKEKYEETMTNIEKAIVLLKRNHD